MRDRPFTLQAAKGAQHGWSPGGGPTAHRGTAVQASATAALILTCCSSRCAGSGAGCGCSCPQSPASRQQLPAWKPAGLQRQAQQLPPLLLPCKQYCELADEAALGGVQAGIPVCHHALPSLRW